MSDKAEQTRTINLAVSPIHLARTSTSVQHNFGFDGPAFEAYIAAHCTADDEGRLIMIEASPTNWGAWECHNNGDEVVIVLEGSGTFIQEIGGEQHRIPFKAQDTVINPRGVWHTADVTEPMRAVYITPCPGTEHRAR